jgi:hypothetical protein
MRQSVANIRIVTILVAAAIGALLISACRTPKPTAPAAPGAASSVWPALSHDRAHTGRSQFDTGANPGALKWRFGTAGVLSSPAIGADGTIYVGSGDSNLYAVSANGIRKWAFKAETPVGTPVLADAGTIYVRGGENLYAVDTNSAKKWIFSVGAGSAAPAVAKDGTVYVADDANLYSLNANGTLKWKSAISYAARSSPAIGADGTIYLGSGDGNLYAINSDGTRKWAFATGSFVAGDRRRRYYLRRFGLPQRKAVRRHSSRRSEMGVRVWHRGQPLTAGNRCRRNCVRRMLRRQRVRNKLRRHEEMVARGWGCREYRAGDRCRWQHLRSLR